MKCHMSHGPDRKIGLQEAVDDQPMTVLEVRRDAIKVVVSKQQSRVLEGLQKRGAPQSLVQISSCMAVGLCNGAGG